MLCQINVKTKTIISIIECHCLTIKTFSRIFRLRCLFERNSIKNRFLLIQSHICVVKQKNLNCSVITCTLVISVLQWKYLFQSLDYMLLRIFLYYLYLLFSCTPWFVRINIVCFCSISSAFYFTYLLGATFSNNFVFYWLFRFLFYLHRATLH